MRVSFRVGLIIFVGIMVVLAVGMFSYIARVYFIENNEVLYSLNSIAKSENNLNYELLRSSLFLYSNNDLIASKIKNIEKNVNKLKNKPFFKVHHKKAYEAILMYEKEFNKKKDMIFEYLRYSIPIKNAMTYLAKWLENLPFDNKEYARHVLEAVSSIYLAKNSVDIDFLRDIDLNYFKKVKLSPKDQKFNEVFLINLNVFLKYFPKYREYLKKILNSNTKVYLNNAMKNFLDTTKKDTSIFDILSILMILFIGGMIFALITLIHKLEIEIQKVRFLAEHDPLTGLYNRIKFNEDEKHYKKPVLILFNIDRFKYINDYFGVEVGDKVLKFLANELVRVKDEFENSRVYRFGADDFGILFERGDLSKEKIKKFAQDFIENVEKSRYFLAENNLEINVSLSAGISFARPLFENADMALKVKSLKDKVTFFDPSLNEIVKNNIKKSNEIKKAIETNNVFAYFQPIFDENKNIIKYETLCRVRVGKEVKSIFPYLDILKENKMYHFITKIILNEAKNALLKYPHIKLSINISIEDILNEDINRYIFDNFAGLLSRRITFEILESEIGDYDSLNEFIKRAKKYGMEIAVDDFGSGYSNFSRVLKMDLDYLKIDGSLIKNLDTDEHSKLIVETIVNFSKKSNVKTIAEFVHSENIFQICKNLGIDYFQGFYLGEPIPKIE